MNKILFVLMICLSISSCATKPILQKPVVIGAAKTMSLFHSAVLEQSMHTLQPLNADRNIIYYQTYGGGGLGVGLLGPFGVMANIKMIEANTMKEAAQMKGKLAVMPASIFVASAKARHWQISTDGATQRTQFCPYLLVEKTEGDVLQFAAAVLIDTGDKLPSKYLVELPLRKKSS